MPSVAFPIIWTPSSLADIQRLYRFLAEKDPDIAKQAIAAIRQSVQPLEIFPNIGRPVQEMSSEYREILIDFGQSGYVLLYRLDQHQLSILAVRHQREVGY
ncbi:Plasmid stabilization system protein ParE [Acinetobacter marinus]|uniref:Plasmid stabilization system protein ParE n=1 Tax=Acinetobacter marinus TaxID=281375 RepID=A0A1G6ISQ7_9GAMM|nr:type II toxin-antitoxin system RelE/ParE family toxin [Acinetobacter marinus]SDC09508.1 Plasmid stabilization system protein ParE [Acinetobacter marinus]